MGTSSSAKQAPGAKSASAKNTSGADVETFDSPRRGMGVPLVGCADPETGPDEPQMPPMPGPQSGSGRGSGTCKTCHAVPFGGPMAIALMSVFLLLLSGATLLATSLIGTQQHYLNTLTSEINQEVHAKTIN